MLSKTPVIVPFSSAPSNRTYRARLLASLVVVLGSIIALVRLWPAPTPSVPEGPFGEHASKRIQVNEVQPTAQSRKKTPPPPAPAPPEVVPNDVVIEDEIEFEDGTLALEEPGEDEELQDGIDEVPAAARRPDTDARLFRAVQPDYPSAARDETIQARVRVSVQVTETGEVEEAAILKRWRLSEGGRARPVSRLDHGLEEAALGAARRSRFRPAEHNGTPVASQTTLTFEFGPSGR